MAQRKGSIVFAFLLIVVGAWFLAIELYPGIKAIAYGADTWPYPIIGIGLLFCLVGLLAWTPALFIPGCVIAGIGGLLYYQNSTHNWASWSYAWTLIPGFAGIGLIIFGALARRRGTVIAGFWNLCICLILFGVFGYALGRLAFAGQIWPVGLIALGLYLLLRSSLFRRQV